MKRFTIVCMIVLFICSCSNKKNKIKIQYDIDVNCKHESSFDDIMDFSSIIPLETNDNSLITGIDKIVIRNNFIYLFKDRGTIKVFDLKGKFITSIGTLGKGPGELLTPTDFDISPDGKTIAILDRDGSKLSYYNNKGTFIKSVKNSIKWGFRFCWMDTNRLLFTSLYRKQKFGCYQVYETDTLLRTYKGILPYNEQYEGLRFVSRVFQRQGDKKITFRHPIECTVFDIDQPDQIYRYINFGSAYLPDERKVEYVKNNNLVMQDSHNANFAILWNYIEEKDWAYAWYHTDAKSYSLVLDKKSKNQIRYRHTASLDYLSDITIIGSHSNQLIASIEPFKIKERISRLSKGSQKNEKIMRWVEVLKNITDSDNPIIVFLKPKEI